MSAFQQPKGIPREFSKYYVRVVPIDLSSSLTDEMFSRQQFEGKFKNTLQSIYKSVSRAATKYL